MLGTESREGGGGAGRCQLLCLQLGLPVLLSPSMPSWAFSFSFDSSKENTGMDSMVYSKRNVAETIMSSLIQQAKMKSFN